MIHFEPHHPFRGCTRTEVAGSPASKTCCTFPTKIKLLTVTIPFIFHSKYPIFDALEYNGQNLHSKTHFVILVTPIYFFTIALVNMTPFLLITVKLTTSGLLRTTQNLGKR